MKTTIFIDLDETLIHSRYGKFGSENPSDIRKGEFIHRHGSYWYGTVLRECALPLIEFCKGLGEVKILTAASKDYAIVICDHFRLCPSSDIISREDYTYEEGLLYSWEIRSNGCINQPDSILIDNNAPFMENAIIKMEYLGIGLDRYIVFPEWDGNDESASFAKEYAEVLEQIKKGIKQ